MTAICFTFPQYKLHTTLLLLLLKESIIFYRDLNNKGEIQYTRIQEVITFFFLLVHSYFYLALSLFFLKNVLSPSCSVYLLVMNSRSFGGKQKALLCFWNMFCVVQPLEKCIAPCFLSERWRLFHCLLTHVVSDKKLTDIRNCSFLFIVTYSFSGCF